MKTLFFSLVLFFTFSCNKSDQVEVPQVNNPIISSWKLIKFEAGFGPTFNYTNSEIIWTFNQNNTIDALIASGTNVYSNLPLKLSGNYNYSIANNGIVVNNEGLKYEISGNVMIITDFVGQAADGRKLTFNKIQ